MVALDADRMRSRVRAVQTSALDRTVVQACYTLAIMKPLVFQNRRTRLRLVLLAVLSLLFQQVALAAYVCPIVNMSVSNVGMTVHCDGMPMMHKTQDPALCLAHCAQGSLATQDVHAPTVPPLSMPALLPAPIVLATLPAAHATHERAAAWRLAGISPALRYRVLLI